MKKNFIIVIVLIAAGMAQLNAQMPTSKKLPSIGLHFFYNDFVSAQSIKSSGIGTVIKNNSWNRPYNMQGGFGMDYLQGLTNKIDAVGTINASMVDYLLPTNIAYGSSNLLIDINMGAHIKMLSEKHPLNPFLIAKFGYSSYKNINGFSLLPGAGLQANLFNEASILTTIEYRAALSNTISNQLYYSVGIATNISKGKKAKTVKPEIPVAPIVQPVVPVPVKAEIKLVEKDLAVIVKDEATGQPLQYASVTVKGSNGNVFNAATNAEGLAVFSKISAGDYSISGMLNKIAATEAVIAKNDFVIEGNQLQVVLTHNDPRFTLVGNTVDKSASKPVSNTAVTITNTTHSSTSFATSDELAGEFRVQLEAASDFAIVGKKANYISNIESISTKGLSRSTTLYVKLQLGIEEAGAGKTIVLNKIYFQTGRADINTGTSADLLKLVQFLNDNPLTKLEIQGHTDNTGSLPLNMKLSQERANSIVNYLVKKNISSSRLQAKGYGPNLPVAGNITAEGRAQNRRVEMKVL
jgi:outer membrane protein OmpA-like peptidoglycan-associated protein